MKVDNKVFDTLKKIGLSEYEIQAYANLLTGGTHTASEISTASGVPNARIYDVMESLEKKGFVLMKMTRPAKYTAVPPKRALERYNSGLKLEMETELKRVKTCSEDIVDLLERISDENLKLKKPTDVFSVREGDEIWVDLEGLIDSAEMELAMTVRRRVARYIAENLKDAISNAWSKGVNVRILLAEDIDENVVDVLNRIAHLKKIENPNHSFIIKDNEELLIIRVLGDTKDEPMGTSLWSESTLLTKTFDWVFEQIWNGMK